MGLCSSSAATMPVSDGAKYKEETPGSTEQGSRLQSAGFTDAGVQATKTADGYDPSGNHSAGSVLAASRTHVQFEVGGKQVLKHNYGHLLVLPNYELAKTRVLTVVQDVEQALGSDRIKLRSKLGLFKLMLANREDRNSPDGPVAIKASVDHRITLGLQACDPRTLLARLNFKSGGGQAIRLTLVDQSNEAWAKRARAFVAHPAFRRSSPDITDLVLAFAGWNRGVGSAIRSQNSQAKVATARKEVLHSSAAIKESPATVSRKLKEGRTKAAKPAFSTRHMAMVETTDMYKDPETEFKVGSTGRGGGDGTDHRKAALKIQASFRGRKGRQKFSQEKRRQSVKMENVKETEKGKETGKLSY